MRVATVAQVAALADAIDPRFRALVLVAAYAGLRWGELVGLRVKRVDLLHSRITVAEQATEIDGQFTWGAPKTEAGRRIVALPAVAAAALVEHLGSYSQPGPDGLVFTSTEGALLRRSNFNRRVWRPATRAVGLKGLRFHDLRHTSATLSIAAGASTRELMARMGHSSSAAALRYQHVMAGRDAAIAAALDELIEAASTLEGRNHGKGQAVSLRHLWPIRSPQYGQAEPEDDDRRAGASTARPRPSAAVTRAGPATAEPDGEGSGPAGLSGRASLRRPSRTGRTASAGRGRPGRSWVCRRRAYPRCLSWRGDDQRFV
jgi:hypothetical protein